MKKIIAAFLTLLVAVSMAVTAYADLGQSDFVDWYVVCGPQGFDFENHTYEGYKPFDDRVEPGIKLFVHTFNGETYRLVIDDDRYDRSSAYGFVDVSESDFEKYFIEENETVSKDVGKKLAKSVNGTVTSKTGVMLRQGPATTYKDYAVIPHNTKLSYQYTYNYGGHDWGFVTYKGRSGWACIDYIKAENTNTNTGTKPTSAVSGTAVVTTSQPSAIQSSTDVTEGSSAEAIALPTEDGTQRVMAVPEASTPQGEAMQQESFFANTRNVIVVCCLGAVILALSAAVILLLIQKKKSN